VGLALTMTGVALVIVQVGVVGPVVKRVGNRTALVVGLIFGALGMVWAGVAPTGALFWLGIPIIALWGLAGAANQTLMTRHVDAAEQGQLQGANASLTGISELLGPLTFSLTFAYFVTPGHKIWEAGAPFLLGGAILIGAAVWAFVATRSEHEPA
jgi:DHA1 family tetracycline resistance protein-like MFS transporter